jgi:thiamine pyrophosphate-dependent acetolactate synthase large subunit-like protein
VNDKLRLTGAQAIISTLRRFQVDTVFGIPGVHTLPLYDAIRAEAGLRHVLARHEQGAGFMAEGYARASGKPGVVITITGPGVTNVATPVASAYSDSIPLLVISTSLPRATIGHARGELHELKNQAGVMEALAGWTRTVEYVEELPDALRDAFRVMQIGRSRGAYLQIPLDLLEAEAEVELPSPDLGHSQPPSPQAIKEAVRMLSAARHPLIIAGAGVSFAGANHQLQQLAELLQAPVLLGRKSHDVLPGDHPLVLNVGTAIVPELRTLIDNCDMALVIGSKLAIERRARGRLPLPPSVIQVDIDPSVIGHNHPVTLGIVGDARDTLTTMLEALQDTPQKRPSPEDEIAPIRESLRQRTRKNYGETVAFLDSIREALPRESLIVADMTLPGYASSQYLPVYEPRTFIHPSELCTIGCGLPLAIGAKIAAPQRPVVALCGDGGFLLNVGELATAAQEQVPVMIVIFNDSTYTAVKGDQKWRFQGRYIATDLQAPDYVALAQAFHIQGVRVEKPEELREALSNNLKSEGPTVIEVSLPPGQW